MASLLEISDFIFLLMELILSLPAHTFHLFVHDGLMSKPLSLHVQDVFVTDKALCNATFPGSFQLILLVDLLFYFPNLLSH